MSNKLLVYLVFHSEVSFVGEALNSVLNERSQTQFDILIIDTSNCRKASKFLSDLVPPEIEIIKRKDILSNVVKFVFERYILDYEYIIRLDADDIFVDGALAKLLYVLEGNEQVGAVYGGWKLIDSQSNYIADVEPPDPYSLQGFHGACTMFKTSALEGLDFNDLSISSQDGFAVYMHLYTSNWKMVALPYTIFKYRRHWNNLSSNKARLWDSRLNIFRYHVPQPSVDTSIFIDCNVEDIGKNDHKFILKQTATYQISNGQFSKANENLMIPKGITLTKFIENEFQNTAKSVVAFNFKKIQQYYFDGLLEYICLVGDIVKAQRVHYAYYLDAPLWQFDNKHPKCLNHQIIDNEKIINKNYFCQVHGINYFNYSTEQKLAHFIATNNLFTANVELNE